MFKTLKIVSLVILSLIGLFNQNLLANTTEERISLINETENKFSESIQNFKRLSFSETSNKQAFINILYIYERFRASNINIANELLKKIQNKKTLSGNDLYLIKRHYKLFHQLNLEMSKYADLYYQDKINLAEKLARNLNNEEVSSHLIWINAHLIMINHIIDFHRILYTKNDTLRRIIKNNLENTDKDPEAKKNFKETHQLFREIAKRTNEKKFKEQVVLVYLSANKIAPLIQKNNIEMQLVHAIKNNPITLDIVNDRFKAKLNLFTQTDSIVENFNKATSYISGKFGNWAGAIRFREGYLYKNIHIQNEIQSKLKPFDILMEKTPFILTDKLIPGHYGHVAIYLGTPKELKDLNLWNHPSIKKYHQNILNGQYIIEAVRSGVRLTSLSSFLDIDEIAIMRDQSILNSENSLLRDEMIFKAFDQLGKPYDFNFDISTLDEIVCSELIYISYGHVSWPSSYRFGRPTFSPDEVAEILYFKKTKFDLVTSIKALNKKQIYYSNKQSMSEIFDYELRAFDGSEIKDYSDLTNTYWKKTTSCYNLKGLAVNKSITNNFLKLCKTEYKEFLYEELQK